eukprot:scaffold45691_cov214-Amphora_coffeaeformis.AAC.2
MDAMVTYGGSRYENPSDRSMEGDRVVWIMEEKIHPCVPCRVNPTGDMSMTRLCPYSHSVGKITKPPRADRLPQTWAVRIQTPNVFVVIVVSQPSAFVAAAPCAIRGAGQSENTLVVVVVVVVVVIAAVATTRDADDIPLLVGVVVILCNDG